MEFLPTKTKFWLLLLSFNRNNYQGTKNAEFLLSGKITVQTARPVQKIIKNFLTTSVTGLSNTNTASNSRPQFFFFFKWITK